MTKRLIILLASLALVVPFVFYGCSGDDGSAGPAGAAGAPGGGGAPGSGVVAEETCTLCHSAGQSFSVHAMHRLDPTTGNPLSSGSATITVNSVTFGGPDVDNNVPVTVGFTFAARNSDNAVITNLIDLTTRTGNPPGANDNLAFLSFTIAKLVAGTNGDPNEWFGYVVNPGASGSSPFRANRPDNVVGTVFTYNPATGVGSYRFPTAAVNVSDGYVDNVVHRVAIQFSIGNPSATTPAIQTTLNSFTPDTVLQTSSNRPAANGWLDVVPPVGGGLGAAPGASYPTKDVVRKEACNACHDPLAIHGGGRREIQLCVTCHNAKIEIAGNPAGGGWDNGNLVRLIHGVHQSRNLGSRSATPAGIGDFSEVTFPQDIRNCTTCHKGGTDSDNYKNKPSIEACGSCHRTVNFATGANHPGLAQPNSTCYLCHPSTAIPGYHATENVTPNNLAVPGTLKSFKYDIASVTVDNANVATIKFSIKTVPDNVLVNLGDNVITRPTGFSGGPAFLFAYALPQDNVAAPADYNNLGRTAGQPESLSIVGLPIVAKDNTSYTVTRANAFPPVAKMRAVALQGYFTQTTGGVGLDNVGRHTFSVVKNVTGDAVRRVAVESGYTNNNDPFTGKPVGCLECHEIFEGHGGNRVSNAQVCVMCHNPNLSSSGRTITASPINPDIVALFGSDPLQYPEVSNNFKELIHGIHGAAKRTTNFVDIRNRLDGVLLQGDEITFPGNLMHCGKCHLNNLYQNIQTTGRLLSTVKTTTGAAGETVADINAARASVPNATDLVNTPATSACGHCHDSVTARSHFVAMGGEVRAPRGTAVLIPPPLMPDITP